MNDRSRDIGPFVPAPDDDMIICRCEAVSYTHLTLPTIA